MSEAAINTANQDKRKAKKITIIINGVILALLLFPFITHTLKSEINYDNAIVMDFSKDFKSGSKRSSTKKSKVVNKKTTKTKKVTPNKPKVKAVPVPTAPHKPVVETKAIELPPIKTAPVKFPEIIEAPEPDVIPEDPTPVKVAEPIFDADDVLADIESTESDDAESASGGSATAGEGDSGTSTTGDADTNGNADAGNGGLDFSGDGLLTRRIIHRANAKKLAKEEGVIVVNVCVNRKGTVIHSEYNKDESTIETTSLIRDAQNTALEYRFEKDYTAAPKQCGKMTFIFEIEN